MNLKLFPDGTITTLTTESVSVTVFEKGTAEIGTATTYGLATLYCINGGFTPYKVYVFVSTVNIQLAELQNAVKFFFLSTLDTDLYVLEIPKESSLFKQQSVRWYGLIEKPEQRA